MKPKSSSLKGLINQNINQRIKQTLNNKQMNKELHFVFDNQKLDQMQAELTKLTEAVTQISEALKSLKEGQIKSEYMTEKEVAELLRKGVKYIRGLRNDNRLPYYRFEGRNGSVLYKRAEVQSYIQKVLKR